MKLNRRTALLSGCAAAAANCLPSRAQGGVLGANEKVNVAWCGVGGRGPRIIENFERAGIANFVAFCDVDPENPHINATKKKFPDAKVFQDWRVMLDKMDNEIDAVVVLVPDHSHFPISMAAMAAGKHVYTEKPLARTFEEIELLMAAEKRYGVATQMGNQGHSGDNYFQFKAWQDAGIINNVTHVDAYMNKWRRWHPWGDIQAIPTGETAPKSLDWNLWHSTTPTHAFSEKFHPGNWRGWYQHGTGCFGDWGAHILDTIHRFLDLGMPEKISATKLVQPNDLIYPLASTINFQFPRRGAMPAMDIDWYDGTDNLPPLPDDFGGRKLDTKIPGKFIYSGDYVFQGGSHASKLEILSEEKRNDLQATGRMQTDFGKNSDHYANFLLACRGDEETRSPFSVSGPLSQVLVLGCLAQRLGGELEFDRETKQITNNELANSLLKDTPRKGWEQYYAL
ncbi:Gfo/Idh/MocA family protein [Rhodopirellula sp. SWK7]|uniref:Gfo/Idh/MocA family protein n=1 Tax=Rhodopirellula sp. SWK7 TaxID=595460 RepID=UPI0002C01F83|nr:Gfo/Idh/MocA family oxidoreductase [Rhodopirellula sp. SWK7]EMI47078.1 oxidoreductase domain-containing protein [Rhodopirellula sp. SWK7]